MNGLIDWEAVKKGYKHGLSDAELAEKFGIKKATVKVHRNRHKWGPANRAKHVNKSVTDVTKKNGNSVTKSKTVTVTNNNNTTYADNVAAAQGLNDRQRRFCEEYAISFNATQAYINVYETNVLTAQASSSRLLSNVKVKRYIDDIRNRSSQRLGIDTDYVLKRLIQMLNAKFTDYISYQSHKMPDLDENGNQRADADGQPVFYYKNVYHLKSDADWSLVGIPSQGKDGINVPMTDKLSIAKELLNWLPEHVDTNKQENPFLKAWSESPDKDDKEIFDEHPDKFEIHKAEKSDDDEQTNQDEES